MQDFARIRPNMAGIHDFRRRRRTIESIAPIGHKIGKQGGIKPSLFHRALLRPLRWLRASFPLSSGGAIAEPWRRLVAAAIDVALLAFVHCAVIGVALNASTDPSSRPLTLPDWFSPVLCWLYVLTGWSLGATAGMWFTGIRIRRLEGGRPGPLRALARIAGYIVASLPVKAGLYPILTHPLRQGWHDQIARTIVVKASATDDVPKPSPRISTPSPMPADLGAGLRGWGWALLYCVALTLAFTYPLVRTFSTRLAGVPGDSGQFAWNYWAFSHAVTHHQPLATTRLLFFPVSTPLYYHTMDWVNCALAMPLLSFLGIVTVYNILWVASLSLTTFTTYLLLAAMVRNRAAAAVVAPVYGLSSFMMLEGFGHDNIISAEFLPLFALMLYAALTTRRTLLAVVAGVCLGLAGLCDFQFLVFGAVLAFGLLAAFWRWSARLERAATVERAKLTTIALGIGALMLSGLIVPAIAAHSNAGFANASNQAAMHRASLDDFVSLSPLSTLQRHGGRVNVKDLSGLFGRQGASISLLALVLAAGALVLRYRRLAAWTSALAFGVVFTCGPSLVVRGDAPPALISLFALGFPGNGFSLPWDFFTMTRFALDALSRPGEILGAQSWIILPFTYIPRLIPPLRAFRTPGRAEEVVLICVCVLASYGLSRLLAYVDMRKGRAASAALLAVCGLVFVVELLPFPYPTADPHLSPFLTILAQDKRDYPVVNLPLSSMESMMIEPAVHHKAVFDGHLSRTPVEAYALLSHNRFLQYCTQTSVRGPEFPVDKSALTPENLRRDLGELSRLGARYVILHKLDCTDTPTAAKMMEKTLGLQVVYNDSIVRVYAIPR
ncbi:MAG: RDD family protein [Capsulimonadaceae bacterium]|nr:RDD family protein [Capsulimonadaceae bacterium]